MFPGWFKQKGYTNPAHRTALEKALERLRNPQQVCGRLNSPQHEESLFSNEIPGYVNIGQFFYNNPLSPWPLLTFPDLGFLTFPGILQVLPEPLHYPQLDHGLGHNVNVPGQGRDKLVDSSDDILSV